MFSGEKAFFQRSRSALVHNCQDSLQMQVEMQKQTRMHKQIDLKGFEVPLYGLLFLDDEDEVITGLPGRYFRRENPMLVMPTIYSKKPRNQETIEEGLLQPAPTNVK